jgi:hypothetical protein
MTSMEPFEVVGLPVVEHPASSSPRLPVTGCIGAHNDTAMSLVRVFVSVFAQVVDHPAAILRPCGYSPQLYRGAGGVTLG